MPSWKEGSFTDLTRWANAACGSSWKLSFSNASSWRFCLRALVAVSSTLTWAELRPRPTVILIKMIKNFFSHLFPSCYLSSLPASVLHNHAHYLECILIISSGCKQGQVVSVMGCDGGTIPRRDELVKLKKKAEKVWSKLLVCIYFQWNLWPSRGP